MYFVYVDESGNRDPRTEGVRADGTSLANSHVYVLIGVALYELD